MNQSKRTKGRGSGGFNRPRNRGQNTSHSHTVINNQNDDIRQNSVDIYQNPYLVHSIISLLGCLVEVTVPNGTVYEGVLKTVSHTLDVTLEMAHIVQKKSGQQKIEEYTPAPSKEFIIETLVIGLKNIICIAAKDVDLDEIKKADNFTDTAISSRQNGQAGHERQLQKWEDPSGEHDHDAITGVLEDSSMKNGLDPDEMFATNKEKYGVTSSFDQNMLCYTTPVEGSKELEDKAELLAREIEKENSHSDRNEVDSGKTEEELFSAVVRASPTQGKGKAQGANRDDNKRDTVPAKDLPTVSPPKPQRVQREKDNRLSDNTAKPTAVIEQVKSPSRHAVGDSTSAEHEPMTDTSSVKSVPKPKVVSAAAEGGITIVDVKQPKGKTSREEAKGTQPENVKEKELEEFKSFQRNFKLVSTDEVNAGQSKEPPTTTSAQQPTPKEQTPSSKGEEDSPSPQQRDSPKVQEQQRSTDTPPKNTEKEKKSSSLNPNAKEFKPSQGMPPRTPPTTPQYNTANVPPGTSPTSVRGLHSGVFIRGAPPIKGPPRSPYTPTGPRFFQSREASELHGSPGMSAAAATGNPIITQGTFPHLITVQGGQPYPGGIPLTQMPPQGYMLHLQGAQQHYVVPHSVGNTSVQSVAQSYQENPPLPVYAGTIPMSPSSPFQGSPQPSPTTQGQYIPAYISQVMPQQQGNQPPIPQAVMASPNQHPHMLMMQQQGGPQPVAMTGIPVPGPQGNPMIQPFMQGHVGFPASRKPPQQWTPHHHGQYPPPAT